MWIWQYFNRDSCHNIYYLIFILFKYLSFYFMPLQHKLCWGEGGILFYYFHLSVLASAHVSPYRIMKRKFKQWWSTIPTISTKQTTISHFKSLSIEKKTMTRHLKSMSWLGTGTKTFSHDEPRSTGTRPVKLSSGHIK